MSAVSARGDMHFDVIEARMNSENLSLSCKNYVKMQVVRFL
jgi:hypothetical protein